MPLETGFLLNERYRIDRILGQGGMGAVYLATDESLGVPCAVKENLNLSPDSERQFRREATLLASLRHPNLPRVTNHFILGGQQYLVMDFVEGEDLKERLARAHPLPETDVLHWAVQVCDALIYLHGRTPPVVHRDIKPANIRLNAAGEAMLVDFGIAKASAAGQRTTTSAVALTPGFAPPEQYGMGRTDARTDEYALAATLYTLLSGQTPPDSMERLLGNAELIPLNRLRADISPSISVAINRALQVRPDDRFGHVADFKAALLSQTPAGPATVSAGVFQPTLVRSAAETIMAPPPTIPGQPQFPTIPGQPPSPGQPAPAGRPLWLLPLGAGIIFGALILVALVLGVLFAPTLLAAPTPTALPTLTPTPRPPATTLAPPPVTLAPATATPTVAPSATPAPPTPTPTTTKPPTPEAVGTLVGSGGRIAFLSNRDGKFFQIYTMLPDGSDVKQLTTDASNKWDPAWTFEGTQLAWSPDGTKLLFVAPGASDLDIWMINADGTNRVDLTAGISGWPTGDDYQPYWCPDGTIWFTSLRASNAQQVFFTTLDDVAKEKRPRNFSLTHNSPTEWDPVLFPDCKTILVITASYIGAPELRRYTVDNASNKTFRTGRDYNAFYQDPAISPDGQAVLYTSRDLSDGAKDIYWTKANDPTTRAQLTNTINNYLPAWSPDNKWVVFVSSRDKNREIYLMTVSGTGQKNLTNDPAIDTDPVWQPAPPTP